MPTSPGTIRTRSPGGLTQTSTDEFHRHPDHRIIAAFILGWVFWYSLQALCSQFISPAIRRLYARYFGHGFRSRDVEHTASFGEKARKVSLTGEIPERLVQSLPPRNSSILFFTLVLCFTFASMAGAASLVGFKGGGSSAGCAFFIAWGTMASNTAPHVGLFILSLHLRQLGAPLMECVTFWATQCISIIFVFVTASMGTGFTRSFDSLGVVLCYRKHFLPSSLVTSLLNLAVLGYAILRFVSLTTSFRELFKKGIIVAMDSWFVRTMSLLAFELLVLVPNATSTNILGEFVPFSLGAILVIGAFNNSVLQHPLSASVQVGQTYHPWNNTPAVFALDMPSSNVSLAHNPVSQPYFPNHPYAIATPAQAPPQQHIESPQSEVVQTAITGFSEYTFNTAEVQSVNEARIRTASRMTLQLAPNSIPASSAVSVVGATEEGPEQQQQQPATIGRYGKILPPQEQYAIAEQFEREDASRTSGLAPGPPRRPSRPTILIESYPEPSSGSRLSHMLSTAVSQNSAAVYGSDIIRAGSGVKDRTKKRRSSAREQARASWSPLSTTSRSTTSMLESSTLSPESHVNTGRHSFAVSDSGSMRHPPSSGGLQAFFTRNGLPTNAPRRSRTFGSEHASQPRRRRESRTLDENTVERDIPALPPSSFVKPGQSSNPRLADTIGARSLPMVRGPRPPPAAVSRQDAAERSSHYASVHFWPPPTNERLS